jgi:hypothetical protein
LSIIIIIEIKMFDQQGSKKSLQVIVDNAEFATANSYAIQA